MKPKLDRLHACNQVVVDEQLASRPNAHLGPHRCRRFHSKGKQQNGDKQTRPNCGKHRLPLSFELNEGVFSTLPINVAKKLAMNFSQWLVECRGKLQQ